MSALEDKIKGNWKIIKGTLQQKYGQLTDEDLTYQEGREQELIGRLQRKLGKTKEEIHQLIDRL